MTEERKRELAELLEEARKSLVIRYGYRGPLSIPVEVYGRYLQERWRCYGVDFLSFWFSTRFTPDIVNKTTKSKLLNFIRKELSLFLDIDVMEDTIPTAIYAMESDSTHESRLYSRGYQRLHLFLVLERLLEIAIVRGIEAAVFVFNECSRPEGAQGFFQDVTLLEGIKLKRAAQVYEGVRLIPLPSSEISQEVVQYLPGFPHDAFIDLGTDFFAKTLLIVDRPGLSIFHEPAPDPTFPLGFLADDLPFQVEVPDVKFPRAKEVISFRQLFCQALSLVCKSPVQIVNGGWFLKEDKSFNQPHGLSRVLRRFDPFGSSTEAGEAEIEKTRCLYERLVDLDSNDREKLQIPIDRWIMSKTPQNSIDKIIDLGIALEALYLSDIEEPAELAFRLRLHAAWYLRESEEDRKTLMKELSEIYDWRSKVVHTGKLPEKRVSRKKRRPFTPEEVKQFIENAQDRCRESILKILEDGKFPKWSSLILGGEDEQAGS